MKPWWVLVILLGVVFPFPPAAAEKPVNREKVIMGWLESVFLRPWNLRLTAKLDTGAKTSALHADKIERFNRDGKDWVRFTLEGEHDDRVIVVERPLQRTVYIKERQKHASKRDVVTVTVCKNGREYETEFTLVDRSNFNYPLLLGRSFLSGVALVDSSETFLYKAESDPCAQKDASKRGAK